MKPALFVLLCICTGVPVALAQIAPGIDTKTKTGKKKS